MESLDSKIRRLKVEEHEGTSSSVGKIAEKTGPSSSTIEAMKIMANDPIRARLIAHDDACLGGLTYVLDNPDLTIVKSALECLQKLAEYPENQVHMKQCFGMLSSLEDVIESAQPLLADLAKMVYDLLNKHTSSLNEERDNHGPLRDTLNIDINRPKQQPKKQTRARRRSFFVGVNKSKMIVLQVHGMHDKEDLELCRSVLLQVKGVISITFDPKTKRCTMRTKPELRPEVLAAAITKTMTMHADQVVKDELGEETFVSFGTKDLDSEKENDILDYPSDDNSPIKGDKNMARPGQVEKSSGGWGFIRTASNFLQNSFYW